MDVQVLRARQSETYNQRHRYRVLRCLYVSHISSGSNCDGDHPKRKMPQRRRL
jgi:hypothetical protein